MALAGAPAESVSSVSSVSLTNTNHHHSNPLYTDNEYYDEEGEGESMLEGDNQGAGGGGEVGRIDGMGNGDDAALDAGVEWLQRAPLSGDFNASIIS